MEGFQVDELKLYMSEDIKIANGIVLKCPKIRDIAEYGESAYFSMVNTLCATPSSMMVALDDMKLNYMKNNFNKINKELSQKIEQFEELNGKNYPFNLNQNDPLVHSMKVKGKLLENLDMDAEFESADLLDFLGYERIISCKKKNK